MYATRPAGRRRPCPACRWGCRPARRAAWGSSRSPQVLLDRPYTSNTPHLMRIAAPGPPNGRTRTASSGRRRAHEGSAPSPGVRRWLTPWRASPVRGELRPLRNIDHLAGPSRADTVTYRDRSAQLPCISKAFDAKRSCRNVPVNACICDRAQPTARALLSARHDSSREAPGEPGGDHPARRPAGTGGHPGRGRRRRGLHHDRLRRAQRQGPAARTPPAAMSARSPTGWATARPPPPEPSVPASPASSA